MSETIHENLGFVDLKFVVGSNEQDMYISNLLVSIGIVLFERVLNPVDKRRRYI